MATVDAKVEEGVVEGIINESVTSDGGDRPVLQVAKFQPVGGADATRHKLWLTDGSRWVYAMAATQVHALLQEGGDFAPGCLVRLLKYSVNDMAGRKIVILIDLEVAAGPQPLIGAPTAYPWGESLPSDAVGPAPRRGQKRPRAEGTFAEAVLASVTCPISHSLVVRPVLAEDGKCYEREHIERWLRKKKSSPLTNKPMGTHLTDHADGRGLVSSAIENGLVDADAATAWHVASARLKIVAALPGGLDSAKEHIAAAAPSPECEREEASPEREALLEAFALRDRMLALVKRGDRLGLGREFERLLTVDHPSGVVAAAGAPMTTWRGDLVPGQSRIRIIDDVEEFQRLCERPAPGANEDSEVGWCEDEMEELAGNEYKVDGVNEQHRSYMVDDYCVPFDACILVKV